MDNPLHGLEPRPLWSHFDEIRKIPRPSKHEERARQYVLSVANEHGLTSRSDSAGNIVVSVPASPGREKTPLVVLQSHLDMVCEKNTDKVFDFNTDPIELVREEDRILANGTTLGADNGVGVAAALMMITSPPRPHGPLELLFTVDEETGLNGAKGLDPQLVQGKLLINLDSEEDGSITVGCAGGRHSEFRLPLERAGGAGLPAFVVRVSGLSGGHSGMDIHKGRGNAIKMLGGALLRLPATEIVQLSGGSAHNAIPREAAAIVRGNEADLRATLAEYTRACAGQFQASDPGVRMDLEAVSGPMALGPSLTRSSASALLDLIATLPHGELARSRLFPSLVETSANVATVRTDEHEARVLVSWRSSVMRSLEELVQRGERVAREHHAHVKTGEGYPAWEPNPDSKLLQMAVAEYKSRYGSAPHVSAIHAGLECGIIGDRIRGMDMISFGPSIDKPHSPYESVSISSVQKMFGEFLPAVLEAIGERG